MDMQAFVDTFSKNTLRVGITLQLVSFITLISVWYALAGGDFVDGINGLIEYTDDTLRDNSLLNAAEKAVNLRLPMAIITFFFLLGALYLAVFQSFLHQGERANRGFRAGGKFLMYAVTFDILQLLTTFIFWGALCKFDSNATQNMQGFLASGATNRALFISQTVASIGWIFYAAAFFLMELNNTEGPGMVFGWIIASSYKLAAVLGLVYVFLPTTAPSFWMHLAMMVFYGLGLFVATIWAFMFEPTIHWEGAPGMYAESYELAPALAPKPVMATTMS
ncbi:unnamed protein product [Vitrella brassicaformis CCMP3155]|uniref:Uncharacterized protein n=1 Tax=Vitrella brassicaformis (strain CCMP3155) TaxID=1169540 RepID=A0A0G4G7P5_VITBC|nr:unnamed protein product [Vitrella brassicaformis CCMP3155]|eukprot:CEM24671.1 unnamed protein product [Vitrella brassicaformis CCMP3155]